MEDRAGDGDRLLSLGEILLPRDVNSIHVWTSQRMLFNIQAEIMLLDNRQVAECIQDAVDAMPSPPQ